ncbi:hypothetical protein ACH4Y0_35360 [Streptomyces sp. NPDC020707]|uniref:hypothetical protein n=1 Tax=Streptomyces sp. NPDC020707 TaxID=3365084 RepID=UPI00379CF0E4
MGVALLAAVSTAVWIATRGEDEPPVRYTAEMPSAFGDYRLAGPGESLWDKTGIGENLDPTTETAHATYLRADDRKSFIITVDLDPVADVSDAGKGDDVISTILGTSVESGEAKSYDPGPIAGKLLCVQYAVNGTTSSRCLWGNGTALVTAQPVVTSGPRPTPGQTATEVRSFLSELHVHSVK